MTSLPENKLDDLTNANQLDVPDGNTNPFLTYGCLIYLTFSEDNITDYYAYSEGLTKTKVLLKTKESFHKEGSYMRGLFRIYPSFYHAEYGNAKNRLQQIIEGEPQTPLEKRETRAQIPKLIKGVTEELALNFDVYEKLKGTPVRYGQIIQLLHIGSQKYLAYDPESPSDLESDCLKIDLTYENSERTCFRILPTFKYQQESQGYIFNDDIVYMMSTVDSGARLFGDPYLHASRTMGSLNKDTPNKESLEKKEINISSDKKTPWRVKIFSDYISEKIGALSIGDIIWINLSEEDKNLIVHSSNEKESSHSFKFILCSSKDRYRKFVGNSNGMFIVEGLDMMKGGLIRWKTPYRLKHLATNKYLSIGSQPAWDTDERRDKAIYSFKLVNSDKEAANFSFDIVYSTIPSKNKQFFMKYVPKDAYFKLQVENDLWVTYRDVPRDFLESKEQYEEDLITLPLIGKMKENNIFHCSRATQNEIIITMFLISCKNTIRNTLKYLDPDFMNYAGSDNQQLQLKHKIVTYKLERMKVCLKQLELFCHNKLLDYLTSDQIYAQVNPFIQNLLKEQFFIELLAQTLITCFPQFQYLEELKHTENTRKLRKAKSRDNSYSNSPTPTPRKNSEGKAYDFSATSAVAVKQKGPATKDITMEDINHKKKRICELSYKLVIAICQNHLINKNYTFTYLPLFQMQADYIQYSVDCVNLILKDNEELLLNLHKSSVLQVNHSIGSMHFGNAIGSGVDSPANLTAKKNLSEKRDSAGIRGSRSPQKDSSAVRMQGKTGSATVIHPQNINEDAYTSAYKKFYNKILKNFKFDLFKILKDWEAIKFFAALLQRTDDIDKQKKLIYFFKTISLQGSEGININQEIIHKYFTTSAADGSGSVISTENFLKIFTHEGQLYVKVPFAPFKGKIFALKNFLDATEGRVVHVDDISFGLFDEGSSYYEDDKNFLDHETSPNQEILTKHIDLIAALCQSRNFSWKNILEKEINWEALLSYLKQDLPADIRASLGRLLTSLYLDQEPRREAAIPLFCKIVDRKKLAQAESRKDGQELMTMATMKMVEYSEKPNELNIDKFKEQLFEEIQQLKKVMEGLPTELKHDNHEVLQAEKNPDNWKKAYNSYIYEMLQITHLMLKFDKIKIRARKIQMQPLPKESSDALKKNQTRTKKKKLTKNVFTHLNLFASKKKDFIPGEFEEIMRSLVLLLEYDRTYPEAGKMLMEMRTSKQNQRDEDKKLFSKKNLFDRVQGIAAGAKNLIVDNKVSEKRSIKSNVDYDFMDKDLTTSESYLKQGDVMKRILENLLGQQELDIETTIKIKIMDILEYFFDYKQDKLFSNIRRVFFHMMNEADLVSLYRTSKGNKKVIQARFSALLDHYMKYILPRILLTGTPLDNTDEIFKQDNGEDILDINESLDFELLPLLLQQLCLNSNAAFERKILHLMTRMYNQRKEFSESVEDLLLLFEEVNIQNYNKSKKMFKILQKYTEESESWLTSSNVNFDKLKTTKEALLFFYNSVFLEDIEDEDQEVQFDPKKIDNKKPDKVRQEMYRHLKIYVPVVSLIKDNIHIVDTVKKPEILELFRLCFAFLTAFLKGNEENQMILSNSLVVFLYNMPSDLGHVRLLVELFRDNETLCINRAIEVVDDFHRLIINNGRRADYLEFYKVIQNVKGEMVYQNQRMVLDLFLDPRNRDILLYIDKNVNNPNKKTGTIILADRDERKSFMNVFSFEKRIASDVYGTSDEPFYYHAKLFDILGMTACGKEGLILNEIRLRSTISFNYLLQLLYTPDDFTKGGSLLDEQIDEESLHLAGILKVPIAEYIFFVYVESEKNTVELIKGSVSMVDIIRKEKERIQALTTYQDKYLTYLFDNMLLIFYWYSKQSRENQTEEKNQEAKRNYTELLHFVDNLLINLKKFDPEKISQKGKENLHNLLVFVQKDKDLGDFDLKKEIVKAEQQKRTVKELENKDLPEEQIWKFMWQEFVDVFLNSKQLTNEIDKEKKIFAKSLTQIDQMFKKNYFIREICNTEEVAKKLINFIIENENTDETRDTVVLILDALGNLIENETDEEKMVEKQNFLTRMNAVYMIFSKLSDPNLLSSDETFQQLISFAITLLEGGNEEVQKSVYKLFTSFSNSEVFFLKLHDRFQSETQKVKNIQENPNEKISEDECEEMKDILRLLQLFAEGHFSDLQNYIRHQTNSYHSYDLLDDISDLLNAYMQIKHTAFFDTMIQCFDTITEFIQGPCVENQVAIIQGSFLDLACNILSTDELAEERLREQRGQRFILDDTKLRKWQLARLKYKCSITLMSLLEARKDESNVYRMMKSIPIDALRMNITDIYNEFNRQYKGEYSSKVFLHFNFDPDEEHDEKYCSLIIETGFNLYFLLNIFTEAQSLQNDEIELDPDQKIDEEKEEKGRNIVTQWLYLISKFVILTSASLKNCCTRRSTKNANLNDTNLVQMKSDGAPRSPREQENVIAAQLAYERENTYTEASQFFKKNSANIEVLREDNHLEKTYFYLPPFCHAITKDTKNQFNNAVNRSSSKSKCLHLIKEAPDLIEVIKYEYQLQNLYNRVTLLSLLTKNILLWRDTAFLLAIVINLLVITTYYRTNGNDPHHGYDSSLSGLVLGLGCILIVFSLSIVLYFMIKTAPLLIRKAWEGTNYAKLTLTTIIINCVKSLFALLSNFYVLYYSIYGLTAIIGLTVTPFFFAFHMFDVLVRFPLLQSVLQAIWIPRKPLLLTFLLYLLLNYVFSLAGYYFFYSEYKGYCTSTWMCFLTSIDKAFKVDGGIGGFLLPNTSTSVSRFVFDNLYFLLVMIIMINIVSGIIIDNFGSLREEEKEFRFDVSNICFICGHDRETLEKANDARGGVSGSGFNNHIKKEHYLWNYLFYIAYIQDKEKTEYTGLESYIADQIENGEISWFPTDRAKILEGIMGSEDDNSGLEPLKKIEEEQRALIKDASRLSKSFQTLEELLKKYELKKVSSATKQPTFRSITSGGNISDRGGNSGTARLLRPETGRGMTTERRRPEQKQSESDESVGENNPEGEKEEKNRSINAEREDHDLL